MTSRFQLTVTMLVVVCSGSLVLRAEPPAKPAVTSPAAIPARPATPAVAAPASIKWQTSLKKAVDSTRDDKRPMLIEITASWCAYCKKMERESLVDARVIKVVGEQFIAVRLDADIAETEELMEELEIEGLPAMVIVNTRTKKTQVLEGYHTADEILKELAASPIIDRRIASKP